jgi:hypothetical protein
MNADERRSAFIRVHPRLNNMKTLLLKNANVVLPDREAKSTSVFIADGKIASF